MRLSAIRDGGALFLHGGLVSGGGYFVRILSRLIVALLAARFLGVSVFGAFIVAIAVVEAAATASGLGTKWMLFKWLDANAQTGDRPPGHVVADAAILVAGASVLLSLVVLAIALGSRQIAPHTQMALVSLVPVIALQALLDLLVAATRWTHLMRYDFAAKSIIQPFASIAIAAVAFLAGAGPASLAIAYVAGTALAAIYAAYAARRCLGGFALVSYRPHISELKHKLGQAIPTTIPDVIDSLSTRADIYMVTLLLGEHAAGIYGVARQVSLPVRQARQAFDSMLVPLVSRTVAVKGPAAAATSAVESSRLVFLVQAPVFLIIASAAPALLKLAGGSYSQAFTALLLLAAAEWIQGAFGVGDIVILLSRSKLAVLLTASCTALAVVLAVLLAPRAGIAGIAVAVLASYAVRAIARAWMLRHVFGLGTPLRLWIAPIACASAAIAVVWGFYAWPVSLTREPFALATSGAALAVYAVALFAWISIGKIRLLPSGFSVHIDPQAGEPDGSPSEETLRAAQ